MKYKEWLDVWFANYIEPSSKTKTCERYSEIIEKHLKVKLGEYELEELSPIVIQKYITELMQSGNLTTGKGLAANSVNGIITVIQNSLKLAYTLGELKEYIKRDYGGAYKCYKHAQELGVPIMNIADNIKNQGEI